ncbi:MAG TPA: Vms1/Ankzf1 family peptidyl-tRNA hydrolase [Dehalococcoidia bacterium]|nr:Vms1/Ankzf1 family peptidyl-tRNA hydrolase [Dehalococcoidia bacterium]
MVTKGLLSRLASLHSEEGIVSAYIRLDPRLLHEPMQPLMKFKGGVKRFLRQNPEPRWQRALEREEERIASFLQEWRDGGRGLVIFSCAPSDLWEVVALEKAAIPTFISVDTTPDLSILARVADEYPRLLTVVVQRDRARIYLAEMGRLESAERLRTLVPGQHDEGGWAQARYQRHVEEHVDRHLRRVVKELQELKQETGFNRLVVAGPHEVQARFLDLLPADLRRTVIGTAHVDVKHESDEEVLQEAHRVWREHERQMERRIVRELVDEAQGGGRAVVGIDGTIDALLQDRVRMLVMADGVTRDGSACDSCGFFAARDLPKCPVCGGETVPADVVERSVERAYLTQDATVEVVFDEARDWLLAHGGLGAFLRY